MSAAQRWRCQRYLHSCPGPATAVPLQPSIPEHHTLFVWCTTPYTLHLHMQGCEEGGAWVDLRRHEGDATLALPGQFASWPVASPPGAAAAFRCFRIVLMGPNAAGTGELAVSSLELYGYLVVQPEALKGSPDPAT